MSSLPSEEARQLLEKFLQSRDEKQSLQLMEQIIHSLAEPIVHAIIRRKLGVDLLRWRKMVQQEAEQGECPNCGVSLRSSFSVCPFCGERRQTSAPRGSTYRTSQELDAEDIFNDVITALVERLRQWKEKPQSAPLNHFPDYVARLTLNIIALHWRRLSPHLYHLRNKLLYLLEGRGRVKSFALWDGEAPGEQLCGFREWQGKPRCQSERYWLWCINPQRVAAEALPFGSDPSKMSYEELLTRIFLWLGGPVNFDDLLMGLMELLEGSERIEVTANDEPEPESEGLGIAEVERKAIEAEERHLFTCRIWEGLNRLSVNQRRAFLLHQEPDIWEAFISHGCCTWKGLAQLLEMSLDELKTLFARLPLEDEEIAQILNLPDRQKVINLRQAALKNLRRWIEGAGK